MSYDYYIVCDKCKKSVCLGSLKHGNIALWYGDENIMSAFKDLLESCKDHLETLRFVWENEEEDMGYYNLIHGIEDTE